MNVGKARLLFFLSLAAAALQLVHASRVLPATMAVHFNAAGRADGYGSRSSFVLFFAGMFALLWFLFELISLAIRRAPASLINMPKKDYWLAPERRDATFDDFEARMRIFGVATVLLLIFMLYLVLRFNAGDTHAFTSAPVVALVVYIAFSLAWLVAMALRYARAPSSEGGAGGLTGRRPLR